MLAGEQEKTPDDYVGRGRQVRLRLFGSDAGGVGACCFLTESVELRDTGKLEGMPNVRQRNSKSDIKLLPNLP